MSVEYTLGEFSCSENLSVTSTSGKIFRSLDEMQPSLKRMHVIVITICIQPHDGRLI